jgi:hypothetical protein
MKIFLRKAFRLSDGCFPLTPALSLREREKRSQFFGATTADFCKAAYGFYETNQRLFPLPGGEGQGEGKRGLLTCRHFSSPPAFNHCATP